MSTIRSFIGRCYRNGMASYHFSVSLKEFNCLLAGAPNTPEGWISITEAYRGKGWFADISAWQVRSEFLQMLEYVSAIRRQVILEIGTAKGATLLAWCRMATKKVISVDLPGGIHGGGYPAIKQRLYCQFTTGRPEVALTLIQADSHSGNTKAHAERALSGDPIDVLFIDGDHTYNGVKADFELWSPLVRSGGLVIFHDIVPHKRGTDCEVDRLWGELRGKFETVEFVNDPTQGWAGIGILTMP